MPAGIIPSYHDMPSWMERSITRPLTPDVEYIIRQTFLAYGWKEELKFNGYVEDFIW